jgi:ArsR family transcriptional regulator
MNSLFKALGDPTRRRILELLRTGDKNAGEIGAEFDMTGASISHHLTILKNAELVSAEKRGQNIIYRLNTTVFQEMVEWIFRLQGENNED